MHYLYLITRDDGEQYVGVTGNVSRRAWEHRNGYGSSNLRDQNFSIEILEEGDVDYIYSIEDSAIQKYSCSLNKIRGGINAGGLQGSSNGRAKLFEEDVPVIRDLLILGKTQEDIAKLYNVSRGSIGEIARGTGWTHVESTEIIPKKCLRVSKDTRKLLRSEREGGLSIQEITNKYNMKYATVYSHVKDIIAGERNNRKLSEQMIQDILELRRTGLSWDKIAKQLNIGATTARRYCAKAGL